MLNEAWSESEKAEYNRLCKEGTIEGLAYTAIQEIHNSRKLKESYKAEKLAYRAAFQKLGFAISIVKYTI